MPNDKLRLFLQSTGFITAAQAADIAEEFSPKVLGKNDFLLQAGKISDDYFFLSTGVLRAFAHDTDGNEVTTAFYASGQVVFEVASFFQRTPSQEYVQALTACQGWSITYAQLNALFHARPEFREFGRSMLVRGFAALKMRMLATITEPAAARYENLLRTNPEVVQHAPLRHIASYLGITDTSLSRIRKGLARK
ncbi:cyclic nucleotide-binding domain-containing protein [Hymenobacter sp. HMF4947]|uniref:Cyclic nucleotide-binding domain-containing protein n=1 Tax=Hymenobacter ginkgonis TaxID=2682976 RepID=A0A7K1TC07_9BACT|nr:Crp/Fnr family transcriptional regulator [Hymenobacter ginkgonis]MVN75903.1 cyclic nucleotide-binding domain-containing protein [Hymenobacter ginkgonis]